MAGRHRRTRQSHRGRHRKPPQRQRVIIPAVTALAVLGAGSAAIAGAVAGNASSRAGGAAAALPPGPALTSVSPLHSVVLHPVVLHPPAPAKTSPVLRITDVHGPCYVEVRHNGALLKRTTMRKGQQLVFRRHGLDILLGNAGAVRLRIAGHRAVPGGGIGQVRDLRVR